MRAGFRYLCWLLGVAACTTLLVGAVYPQPVCACVSPRLLVSSFADAPADALPADLEAGLARRFSTWHYTVDMLPPDLRRFCVASESGRVDCLLVTHTAPLRERGVALAFSEDAQGFLAEVEVRPFARWRVANVNRR